MIDPERSSQLSLDRTRPPVAGDAKAFHFPAFEGLVTPEGLRLFVARRDELPLIGLRYVNLAGGLFDPRDQPGLAAFTGSVLDEGTERRSAVELADQVEDLGGFLAAGADWDGSSITVGLLAQHLDFGLDLLGEVATVPAFDAAEVERIRSLRLADLERQLSDPSTLASRAFHRALYGDHVYGHPLSGTPEAVKTIAAEDCAAFWRAHARHQGSFALAVGDIDPERVASSLPGALGALGRGPAHPRPQLDGSPPAAISVHIVDLPKAAQTELRVGHIGVPRNHEDRPTLQLLNSILGGKFTSRINLNLRERHGFTYGAHSRFVDRLGPGPFVVSTAIENGVFGRATEEILGELHRLQDEPVRTEELEDARNYLLGVFPYTLQTLQGILSRLEQIALYDLPLDYFDRLPDLLRAVTVDGIQDAARRHLHPEALVVAAAGPAQLLEPQLKHLAPVTVHPPAL